MDAEDSLPDSNLHREWMKALFESVVRTVRQALEHHFEGIADWHAGRCGLATNRDYLIRSHRGNELSVATIPTATRTMCCLSAELQIRPDKYARRS